MTAPLGQKAPSAIRCIKTDEGTLDTAVATHRQKAPSAIRCIKTTSNLALKGNGRRAVRKHRAP